MAAVGQHEWFFAVLHLPIRKFSRASSTTVSRVPQQTGPSPGAAQEGPCPICVAPIGANEEVHQRPGRA
eukprot:1687727-Lingulodinium_polyedra.AAC.1